MKRFLAVLLAAALCVSLMAACGNKATTGTTEAGKTPAPAAPAKTTSLSVGYAKADVTPPNPIPLDGYSGSESAEYRHSTATEWPFYAICVALTDGNGETVLIITLDMLNAYMADAMRDAVSNKTGIAKERIMFHVTHNHSGPSIRVDHPAVTPYISTLTNGVLAAAEAALKDRKPAKIETTFARPEKCNTERHYLLADGSYQSYALGNVPKDQIIGHYGVSDNLLQLVKFTREGGKDVVMVNWQGHPPGTNPNTIATSNYPGVLRNYLETNMNCEAIFILGGSGNLNNGSQIKGDVRHEDYQQLGQNLGAAAVEAAANFEPMELTNIQFKEKVLQLETRTGGARKAWIYTISVGDFALVTAPFEIFDDNAVAVRESSQYKMTFYASCCNGSNGYLPTPPSFDWEITYESRTTEFPEGTAEIVQEELIGMLKELYAQSGNTEKEKPEGYLQPAFVPKTDGVTYKVAQNTTYQKVENDFYAFTLGKDGAPGYKNLLCKDQALVEEILAKETVQLIFDEQNVVVGIAE